MSDTAIKIENLSKQYRLGNVGTGTLSHDLNRWWATIRGKEDPTLKIGMENKLAEAGGDYVYALKDINLEVKQGDILGVIGKNGAGKSTLLKILSRVTTQTSGTVDMYGRVASLLEVGTGFHPELTGRENIFLNGAIMGMSKQEIKLRFDEIVDFGGVGKYIDTPVKRYSSGMYVRLAFAVAAHLETEILIIDEVLAVGDAEFQKKAIGKMQDISKGEGRTVLFVSHNMQSIRNLCKNGILLTNGQISHTGKIDEIVDFYMNDNATSVQDCGLITNTDKYRISHYTKELEFIQVERKHPYLIDVTTPLEFNLKIKINKSLVEIQIISLIDDVSDGGNRVGMSMTKPFKVPQGKEIFEVQLSIRNHNLTKGKYIMDFWICIGDVITAVTYYDAVYDTITFEVDKYKGEYINLWHPYWGKNCYADSEIRVI
jgi:lipopolysaccharide transport system ATP-binding protein